MRDMEAGLKDLQLAVAGFQGMQSEMSPLLVWLGGSTGPCGGEGWTSRGGNTHPASCL